jgi:outer membrane protein TolC
MKRLWLLFLLVTAACAGGTNPRLEESRPAPVSAAASEEVPPPAPAEFTVPGAVSFALSRNPDLRMAAHRIAAARKEVDAAQSAWAPRLGLGASLLYSNDPVNAFMSKLRQRDFVFSPDIDINNPGWQTNTRLSLTAGWQIYDGGMRSASTELSRLAVLIAKGDRDALMNELKASVIDTSLAVFMAEEFTRVASESVRLTEEQVKLSKTRFELGQAQRSDLLSAEVRLAEARETLVRAENAKERALTGLRNLLGLEAAAPLALVGTGEFNVPPVGEEADLVAVALANRPEMKKAADAVRMAEEQIELQRVGYRPTLSAFGSYDVDNSLDEFNLDSDSGTVGLTLDWAIFEGGRTDAKVGAAKAGLARAEEAERKARLGIETDVSLARLHLSEARKRREVSAKSEEQADEALRLIRARYENGAATITEYLDAEVALTGARVRNVTARYDVERATADLRRALGICRAAPEATLTEIPETSSDTGEE